MCDYTQVEYACGHQRYTVRAWCTKYSETHKRCPANVVAIEYRLDDRCGDCKQTSSPSYLTSKSSPSDARKDDSAGSGSSSEAAGRSKASGSSTATGSSKATDPSRAAESPEAEGSSTAAEPSKAAGSSK